MEMPLYVLNAHSSEPIAVRAVKEAMTEKSIFVRAAFCLLYRPLLHQHQQVLASVCALFGHMSAQFSKLIPKSSPLHHTTDLKQPFY